MAAEQKNEQEKCWRPRPAADRPPLTAAQRQLYNHFITALQISLTPNPTQDQILTMQQSLDGVHTQSEDLQDSTQHNKEKEERNKQLWRQLQTLITTGQDDAADEHIKTWLQDLEEKKDEVALAQLSRHILTHIGWRASPSLATYKAKVEKWAPVATKHARTVEDHFLLHLELALYASVFTRNHTPADLRIDPAVELEHERHFQRYHSLMQEGKGKLMMKELIAQEKADSKKKDDDDDDDDKPE